MAQTNGSADSAIRAQSAANSDLVPSLNLKASEGIFSRSNGPNPLVIQCAGCHMHKDLPQIALDLDSASSDMKQKMLERIKSAGPKKMPPPEVRLSEDEQKDLIDYMNEN